MLRKKAKRFLAGLCVAALLTESVLDTSLVVSAAGNAEEAVVQEADMGDVSVAEDISAGDVPGLEEANDKEAVIMEAEPEIEWANDEARLDAATGWTTDGTDGSLIYYATDEEKGTYKYITLSVDGILTIGKDVEIVGSFSDEKTEMGALKKLIKEVRFEEGAIAKGIVAKAFSGCENLETVDLTNDIKLTTIDPNAFENCTALTTVKFNDTLQQICNYAFYKCTSLQEITFKVGLTELGKSAFEGCSSLEKVRIEASNMTCKDPKSSSAASDIFKGCNIKSFELAAKATEEVENRKSIIVPSNLFNGASFAKDVTIVIPAYIQEIGDGAFKGSDLVSIEFEQTDTVTNSLTVIGKEAFSGCKSLAAVNFRTTLQTINNNAFYQCEGLKELVIPNSVTTIGDRAFSGCKGITSLQLSNATSKLGEYIFDSCTSLTEVEIPDGVVVGNYEFNKCTALRKVTIPDSTAEIGKGAFSECTTLPEIVLPSVITEVKEKTFYKCVSLVTAKVPEGVTLIGNSAFEQCASLESNVLPESLVELGNKAYLGCMSFPNIVIPENVEKIGTEAFKSCQLINTVTIKSLKLKTCNDGIFNSCWVRNVIFPEGITEIPAKLFSQATFTTDTTILIPATVTVIGNYAFGGSTSSAVNVSYFKFEEGSQLTTIGTGAFQYCTSIESFVIPDTTTEIGQGAFAHCIKLPSIIIPENVTKIGANAFDTCSTLSDIVYNAIDVTTTNKDIFKACNVKTITIGPKVVTFPAHLFEGAQFSTNQDTGKADLITINVPAATEEIGEYALPNITNLQKLVFENGSKLKKIGANALQYCVNMTVCNLPDSVAEIGNYAFVGCSVLGTDTSMPFSLPANLEKLGDGAFKDCPGIEAVTIGVYVQAVPKETFSGDTGLKTVTFAGAAVAKIGDSAFENCSALETIDIPSSVTSIGNKAFKGCSNLRRVLIPESVTSIGEDKNSGEHAFTGCDFAEFYVVPDSYAEKWLTEKGLIDKTKKLTKITYVLNGGTNAGANPGGYEEGKDTFEFQEPTRPGYKFLGWYEDPTFVKVITGVAGRTGELTVYAKWELATYTITYILDGGTNNSSNPTTYTYESDTVTLQEPTMAGFKFVGWYTDPEDTRTKVTKIEKGKTWGDLILYAKWSGNNAAAPTASLASGSIVRAGTKVKLTTKSAGASIYYTTDGSIPTVESTRYTTSITINQKMTIKAIAAGTGYLSSSIAEFSYDILAESSVWGDIQPEDQAQFTDAAAVPSGIWIAGVKDATYTGAAVTLDIRVYDNKTLLTAGTDYTVKYKNNKVAAEKSIGKKAPTIIVTAKGNYKGKAEVNFTIKPRNIGDDDFVANVTVGKKVVPELWYGGKKLKVKKEFTTSGTDVITFTGVGNFTGTRTATAASSAAQVKINKATFTYNSVTYTGATMDGDDIQLKASYGGKELKEGTDYVCSFTKNVNAGTATMMVIGKGEYTGSVKKTFKITAADISKLSFKLIDENGEEQDNASYTYELGGPKPLVAVYFGTKKLQQGVDYTLSYDTNKTGKGTVTVNGKKNFKSSKKLEVSISKKDVSDLAIVTTDVLYKKGAGAITSVSVTARDTNDKMLVLDTDYSVKYTYAVDTTLGDNKTVKKSGTEVKDTDFIPEDAIIQATVTGKGSYNGSVTLLMRVYKTSLSKAKVKIDPQGFTGSAVEPTLQQMTVTIGKNTLSSSDFEIVDYSNNVKKGTAKVTLKGKGSYGGVKVATFKIVQKNFVLSSK